MELHEHFEPESSDIWQQELLEKFTVTPLEFVSLANNYWGATDEEQIRNLIAIHGTTEVSLEPFKTSFIKEALPNWQEFRWNGARSLSIISCSVSRKTMVSGQGIIISGLISPTHEATVTITIEVPNGTILTRTAVTDHNGEFEYSFNPDAEGIWNITASWGGDEDHQGSSSPRISFVVKAPPPPWESYVSIAAVAIVAIGAAAMIYRRRRAKAHSAR